MLGSREQRIVPMMTSSWLESVNKYSELEGDSAIFASQDSLEVLNWNTHDCGRAGSPLRFDHEEMLGINDQDVSINTPGRACACESVRAYVCGGVRACGCMYACMCVCLRVCLFVCVYEVI